VAPGGEINCLAAAISPEKPFFSFFHFHLTRFNLYPMPAKPARFLTFKCNSCGKPVQVFLQKVSACSHIQPYQGICKCGEVLRHATGSKEAVESYLASDSGNWTHHPHHH
jgi:ribosomal protein S27E